MKYTVIWSPDVQSRLADIWLNCGDRNEITRAAHLIDSQLRRTPLDVGESRGGNTRIVIEHPIAVHYDVSEDDRMVRLVDVRLISGTR